MLCGRGTYSKYTSHVIQVIISTLILPRLKQLLLHLRAPNLHPPLAWSPCAYFTTESSSEDARPGACNLYRGITDLKLASIALVNAPHLQVSETGMSSRSFTPRASLTLRMFSFELCTGMRGVIIITTRGEPCSEYSNYAVHHVCRE